MKQSFRNSVLASDETLTKTKIVFLVLAFYLFLPSTSFANSLEINGNTGSLLGGFFGSGKGSGLNTANLMTILANFQEAFSAFGVLILATFKVVGVVLVIYVLFSALPNAANKRIAPSGVIFPLIAAMLMLSMSTVLSSVEETAFGSASMNIDLLFADESGNLVKGQNKSVSGQAGSILSNVNWGALGGADIAKKAFYSLVTLLQVVGVVSIGKGVYSLKEFGSGKQASPAKTIIFILAGAALVNIIKVSELLLQTATGK